jgi:hypothetical protein
MDMDHEETQAQRMRTAAGELPSDCEGLWAGVGGLSNP